MSHLIESAVFSAREGAGWTGLGVVIPADAARDPRKIADLVGATYCVVARPAFYQADDGSYRMIPDAAVQVRNDNGAPLSVTSSGRYKTDNRQPVDVLEAFRDQLAAEKLEISHAAVLDGGKKIAVSALLDPSADLMVKGSDRLRRYVTLSTGYDKKHGTICTHGTIRVVCANTLAMSIQQAKNGESDARALRYTASQSLASGTLAEMLVNIHNVAERELAIFDALANRTMSAEDVARYFADVLEINVADLNRNDANGKPVISTKSRNMLAALVESYTRAPGAIQGTAWGAINAVTHYATHVKTVRDTSGDGTEAARVNSNMFGDAARLKARAVSLALNEYALAA